MNIESEPLVKIALGSIFDAKKSLPSKAIEGSPFKEFSL